MRTKDSLPTQSGDVTPYSGKPLSGGFYTKFAGLLNGRGPRPDHLRPASGDSDGGRWIQPILNSDARRDVLTYFVNGMDNTPVQHADSAAAIAQLLGREVIGVFNATPFDINHTARFKAGVVLDILQCTMDQLAPCGRATPIVGPGRLDAIEALVLANLGARVGYGAGKAALKDVFHLLGLSGTSDSASVKKQINCNSKGLGKALFFWSASARALFEQLWVNKSKRRFIICHSQGNLITANVCWVFLKMMRILGEHHAELRVFGLASPAISWPPDSLAGYRHTLYWQPGDPVCDLSLPYGGVVTDAASYATRLVGAAARGVAHGVTAAANGLGGAMPVTRAPSAPKWKGGGLTGAASYATRLAGSAARGVAHVATAAAAKGLGAIPVVKAPSAPEWQGTERRLVDVKPIGHGLQHYLLAQKLQTDLEAAY